MEQLTEEQIKFLNKVCKGKWEQNKKGIYVNGSVSMHDLGLEKIPVKFYRVSSFFDCSYNKLESLENFPEYVGRGFYCDNNDLTSLEGSPEYVGGDFCCFYNKLISLEGSPKYIGGDLECDYNNLTSLEGIGEVKGKIFFKGNKIDLRREKELRPEIYKKINLTTLKRMLIEI